MGFPQLLLYATPFFLLAICIEYKIGDNRLLHLYTRQDLFTNIILGISGVIIGIVSSAVGISMYDQVYHFFAPYRIRFLGYEHFGWGVGVWMFAIVADDMTYYWFHRISHRIRVLWACHIVHHNSEQYNFSTSLRNGWFAIMYKPVFWYWLAVLGFHPLLILTCMAMNTVYQFFCHTTILPGWDKLSGWLNTPGLHAIHHGMDDYCIDRNYAGMFILFDRLFGTYQPIDSSRKVTFGVKHPPRSQHFVEVTIHEFRNIITCLGHTRSWKGRMEYLLNPPGWSATMDRKENRTR